MDGDVRSAWIPGEAGKPFSVCWQEKSEKKISTSGHVFIDGKDIASAIIRPDRTSPVERSGVKDSARSIKAFTFSELNLTDDDTIASQYDTSVKDVGTIKVEIRRVRLGEEIPFEGYDAPNRGAVHERAKKAGALCTTFGPSKLSSNSRTVAVITAPYDDDEPGPYVTFIFKYRSREMLKANGIINKQLKRRAPGEHDEVIEIYSDTDDEEGSHCDPDNSQGMRRSSGTSSKKKAKVTNEAVPPVYSPIPDKAQNSPPGDDEENTQRPSRPAGEDRPSPEPNTDLEDDEEDMLAEDINEAGPSSQTDQTQMTTTGLISPAIDGEAEKGVLNDLEEDVPSQTSPPIAGSDDQDPNDIALNFRRSPVRRLDRAEDEMQSEK